MATSFHYQTLLEQIDMSNIRILQKLNAHQSDVTSCDFANGKDYNFLITGSSDKLVRVWMWKTGSGYIETEFSPLVGHKYGVTCVCVSPQATMLATTSIDGTVILWNLKFGSKIHTFTQDNGDAIRICRFSPSSSIIVTAGDNGAICIWDLVHQSLIRTVIQHDGVVQSLAFTYDSIFLISACTLGTINIWSVESICDTTTEECVALFSMEDIHDLGVLSCDFSNVVINNDDSNSRTYTLASSGNDDTIKIWSLTTTIGTKGSEEQFDGFSFSLKREIREHLSAVTCIKFTENGKFLASTGLDRTCRIWDAETGKDLAILQDHTRYVNCCTFGKGSSLLVTGSNDKTVIIWDLTGAISLNTDLTEASNTSNNSLNYLQENAVVRIGENHDNDVVLIQKLENIHSNAINTCDINLKNKLLATGSADSVVKLFEFCDTSQLYTEVPFSPLIGHTYSINQVEFSKTENILATCSLDGSAMFWNLEDGAQIKKPNLSMNMMGVRTCRISNQNKYVAMGGDDELVTIFDFQTMETIAKLDEHTDSVTALAFSADEQFIVTVCSGGSLRLWALETINVITEAIFIENEAHDLGVQNCDFSPNEAPIPNVNYDLVKCYLLATCGNDSLVKLWAITCDKRQANINMKLWRTLVGHGGNVNWVRFSPQTGEIVCSVASDRQARIWSPYSSACLHVLDHDALLTSCAFSYDCSILAVACLNKSVWIWKLPQKLVFQNIIASRIKNNRKNTSDWSPTSVSRWIKSIDLAIIADNVIEKELNGEQLLTFNDDELTTLLDLDENKSKIFFPQLRWLKRNRKTESTSEMSEHILDQVDIPHEFLCPITQEIMRDPVRCSDGYTYERCAIIEWISSGHKTSPMTNEEFENIEIASNEEIQEAIEAFLQNNPI